MALWNRALRQGFRLLLRARGILLLPVALDGVLVALLLATDSLSDLPSGLSFALPVAFPSLFQVASFDGTGSVFDPRYQLPALGEGTLALLVLVLVAQSFLAAGYLGRLEGLRKGARDAPFTRLASRAFPQLLAYHAVTAFLLLLAAPFLAGPVGPDLLTLFLLGGVLVVLYFLFLTPFALVADGLPFSLGLHRSVELALSGARETVPFVLAYGVFTLLLSAAVALLSTLGAAGLFLALPLVGAVGTGLVAATLYLYVGLRPLEPLPAPAPQEVPAEEVASA